MRGSDWLTTNLNATVVNTSVKASCRRFCGNVGSTANVRKDRQAIRNWKYKHNSIKKSLQ